MESSVTVGDHAFSQMQGDLDQQRLLGERPLNDPLADIMVREIQHQERLVNESYVMIRIDLITFFKTAFVRILGKIQKLLI